MRKRILSILLSCVMIVGVIPTMAFAANFNRTGNGTEDNPYVYEVNDAGELSAAVNEINEDISDASYYTISLQDDITYSSGMSFNYNTTTILGNGHTLALSGGIEHYITVVGKNETSTPVLILGSADATDTLTLQGQKTNDCPPFFAVGNVSDGKNCGTLKMYDGVTITGAVGNNYFGGGVIVGSGGYFEMNGGTIEKCGIDGGSTCFGGGVAVINKGKFTMNGGSIRDCFLNTGYCNSTDSYNLFLNYGAGAGVFVSNGAVFKMTGGTIQNNTIRAKNEDSCKSYGVGGGIAVVGSRQSYDITARVEITGGIIEGNHATLGGGGIAVCGMKAIMYAIATTYNPDGSSGDVAPGLFINGSEEDPVQIKNNSADGWSDWSVGGGGILLYLLKDTNQLEINNAVISDNTATNGAGGGIESLTLSSGYPIKFSMENTVLSGNRATEGGGICLYNASNEGVMMADFSKTIITENNAATIGGGISVENSDRNSADHTVVTFNKHCAIYDNTATDVCSDDFYKYSNSTVTALPTAEQMSSAADVNIVGWYEDEEDNRYSAENAIEYTPVDSTTEELQLKAVKAVIHTVRYDTQGGSDVAEQTVIDGKNAVKPDDPTKSGYTFAGWYTEAACETIYDFDTPVTQDITLYAQWSKNSSGGGGGSSTTYYYFAIEKIDAQDSHTLNGAKFGLYLDGKQIATATSNRSGIAMFQVNESDYRKITTTSDLYYQELTAPEGYVVSSDKIDIEKSDLTTSQTTAEKKAETVRNYRSSTPDLLNDDDHFAYVIGYKDGYVRPYGLISRAETTTIFFRLLKDEVRDGSLLTGNAYADVLNSYWANTAISTMTGLGIVQGRSSTTFDPQAPITRAEFAAICARFDTGTSSGTQAFSDISGHWAEQYIQRAAELGWVKGIGDGTFHPDAYITRAEAMTMINRVLNRIPEETGDLLSNMNVWPDCTTNDWFYLAVQEATNSHDFKHKAGNYETWTGMNTDPDWTRYEN